MEFWTSKSMSATKAVNGVYSMNEVNYFNAKECKWIQVTESEHNVNASKIQYKWIISECKFIQVNASE